MPKWNQIMKIIYMRDVLKDLYKKKIPVIICIIICVAAGTIAGYKKSDFYSRLSAKDKVKIEEYYEELEKHEKNVKDTEENLGLLNDKIRDLQSYIDNSIFMQLNPDEIHVSKIQFSTTFSIGNPVFPEDKYLSEVLSISKKGNIYSISIMQPTKEQAVESAADVIRKLSSEYKISEPEITCYVKTDANIANKQKKYLDNLSSYIKKRIDLENRLKNQKSLMDKYESEKKPAVLSEKNLKPASVMLRYALFGLTTGILSLLSIFTIRRIL